MIKQTLPYLLISAAFGGLRCFCVYKILKIETLIVQHCIFNWASQLIALFISKFQGIIRSEFIRNAFDFSQNMVVHNLPQIHDRPFVVAKDVQEEKMHGIANSGAKSAHDFALEVGTLDVPYKCIEIFA